MLTNELLQHYFKQQAAATTLTKTIDLNVLSQNEPLVAASSELEEQLLRGGFEAKLEKKNGLRDALMCFHEDPSRPNITLDNYTLENFTIKFGADPNKNGLHLGHGQIPTRLREWQDKGAKVYFLTGTFTALYGDPTDKKKDRERLTLDQTTSNQIGVIKDVLPFLDPEKTIIVPNHEWYSRMTTEAFDTICENLPVTHIMSREHFRNRDEISGGSYFYPILQAGDSAILNSQMGAGGMDQLPNEDGGRVIQGKLGQDPQIVYLSPLCMGTDGNPDVKMSKSEGNVVPLKDPLETYAILFESMQEHPNLISEFGTKYTRLKVPEDQSPDSVKENAHKVAKSILMSYFDRGQGDRLTKQAISLYNERLGDKPRLPESERYSGLEIEGLDELVEKVLSNRSSPIHQFLDSLEEKETRSISRGSLKNIEGYWSDEQMKVYESDNSKTAVVFFTTENSELHFGQIAMLDKLYEMQTKEGYNVKLVFEDYTVGRVKVDAIGQELANSNAERLRKQIEDFNLLDIDNTTFHNNSDTYSNLKAQSFLDMVSELDFKALADENLIKIYNEQFDLKTNESGPNNLQFQKDIRRSIDSLLVSSSNEKTVLMSCDRETKAHKITEKLYQNIGLESPKITYVDPLESSPGTPMKFGTEDTIYLNGDPSKMYAKIMRSDDQTIEGLRRIGIAEESIMVEAEKTAEYLATLNPEAAEMIGNKMKIARMVTQRFYGNGDAIEAEKAYTSRFLSKRELIETTNSAYESALSLIKSVIDPTMKVGQYRGFIKQGAIKINGSPIEDSKEEILIPEEGLKLDIGKKRQYHIKPM